MKKYIILFPLYNDWASLWKLSKEINDHIKGLNAKFSFLFINDASAEKRSNLESTLTNIDSIKVINMKINHLSGRCIATGLKYINENEEFDYVIVMDSDGEDRPESLVELFNKSLEFPDKTIVVNRVQRSENFFYKLMYKIHKVITLIFTGKLIRFGNFICLPKKYAKDLISQGCLWNSFSATVEKIVKNKISMDAHKGKRYFGPSKISYLKLIHHSFTIISVFTKIVFFRVLLISLIYFFIIYSKISVLNLFPLLILLIFLLIIFLISRRDNLNALQNFSKNIKDIKILK